MFTQVDPLAALGAGVLGVDDVPPVEESTFERPGTTASEVSVTLPQASLPTPPGTPEDSLQLPQRGRRRGMYEACTSAPMTGSVDGESRMSATLVEDESAMFETVSGTVSTQSLEDVSPDHRRRSHVVEYATEGPDAALVAGSL